jgi:hypothetical protein
MKKALIVTLYGEYNFGNRLQNFALQKAIQSFDYEVDNLTIIRPLQKSFFENLKTMIKSTLVFLGESKYKNAIAKEKRTKKFLKFRDRYLKNIIYIPRTELDNKDWSNYYVAVVGSDQVWHNWKTVDNELSYYYLSFIDQTKRVSYAASFGFSCFPEEDIESHRSGLYGMRFLSCREQEGCKLIQDLTGLKARRVLDPTLLLTKDQWCEIEKKPSFFVPNRYLMTFFLGDITKEYKQEIEHLKSENNLIEININNPNDPRHYGISPDEFIWLVHHAEVICTDSFHCSVFSIIFNRGLRVFERTGKYEDMFGRLRDLLELFDLSELAFGHGTRRNYSSNLSKEAIKRYEQERDISFKYLSNALGVKDE